MKSKNILISLTEEAELTELWERILKKLNITPELEEYYARLEEEEDPREDLPTLYDRNS